MTGLERIAEGREAEVFLQPDGTVVKLMRSPDSQARVAMEAAAYRALQAAGQRVPAVHGIVTIDGRPGLVMDRVGGIDLLASLQSRPWMVLTAGRVVGNMHASLHDFAAPAELPDTKDILRERMDSADNLPVAMRDLALRTMDQLPSGDRLCHTDFHIGNLIGSWTDPVAIDWGSASRGDPIGDVAKTVLLHKMAALPPETPAFFRALTAAGRRLLVGRYLATYRHRHPVDQSHLDRWMFVQVAARLGDRVPDEPPIMLRYLDRHASAVTAANLGT